MEDGTGNQPSTGDTCPLYRRNVGRAQAWGRPDLTQPIVRVWLQEHTQWAFAGLPPRRSQLKRMPARALQHVTATWPGARNQRAFGLWIRVDPGEGR